MGSLCAPWDLHGISDGVGYLSMGSISEIGISSPGPRRAQLRGACAAGDLSQFGQRNAAQELRAGHRKAEKLRGAGEAVEGADLEGTWMGVVDGLMGFVGFFWCILVIGI